MNRYVCLDFSRVFSTTATCDFRCPLLLVFLMIRHPPTSTRTYTLVPYPTLSRSKGGGGDGDAAAHQPRHWRRNARTRQDTRGQRRRRVAHRPADRNPARRRNAGTRELQQHSADPPRSPHPFIPLPHHPLTPPAHPHHSPHTPPPATPPLSPP